MHFDLAQEPHSTYGLCCFNVFSVTLLKILKNTISVFNITFKICNLKYFTNTLYCNSLTEQHLILESIAHPKGSKTGVSLLNVQ